MTLYRVGPDRRHRRQPGQRVRLTTPGLACQQRHATPTTEQTAAKAKGTRAAVRHDPTGYTGGVPAYTGARPPGQRHQEPAGPSQKVRLVVGVILIGLLVGLAIMLIRELLDKSSAPPAGPNHFKLPGDRGDIPEKDSPDDGISTWSTIRGHPAAEAYRMLRMSVLFESWRRRPRPRMPFSAEGLYRLAGGPGQAVRGPGGGHPAGRARGVGRPTRSPDRGGGQPRRHLRRGRPDGSS